MRKWRVARVTKAGTLFVGEQEFWMKNGAQSAANSLNITFADSVEVDVRRGHNFFVLHVDQVDDLKTRLEETK